MAATSARPADTRMMGIVHQALRRDLVRAKVTVAQLPPPLAPQRKAIAQHLKWMMLFLTHHHAGEDSGLFPMVRDRNPAAAPLLDAMNADHEVIEARIAELSSAAGGYGADSDSGDSARLLDALEALEAALLPHLRREEDDVMPVVAAAVSAADWKEWDEEYNLAPKSLIELGKEGHWLIDSLGHDDRQVVVGLVPPLQRFVLLHGFAGSYRRHLSRCWGRASSRRVQRTGMVEVTTHARPAQVMDVVCDISRIGEWSGECNAARWLGDATGARPGAQFRGRNRVGQIRWGRKCQVIAVEPLAFVWRTIPTLLHPDSVEWTIGLQEAAGTTRITQTYQVLKMPMVHDRIYATVLPGHRDRRAALEADLQRLGEIAALGHQTAVPSAVDPLSLS